MARPDSLEQAATRHGTPVDVLMLRLLNEHPRDYQAVAKTLSVSKRTVERYVTDHCDLICTYVLKGTKPNTSQPTVITTHASPAHDEPKE